MKLTVATAVVWALVVVVGIGLVMWWLAAQAPCATDCL